MKRTARRGVNPFQRVLAVPDYGFNRRPRAAVMANVEPNDPLIVRQGSSDGFVVATLVADAARKRLKSLLPAHHIIADELLADPTVKPTGMRCYGVPAALQIVPTKAEQAGVRFGVRSQLLMPRAVHQPVTDVDHPACRQGHAALQSQESVLAAAYAARTPPLTVSRAPPKITPGHAGREVFDPAAESRFRDRSRYRHATAP